MKHRADPRPRLLPTSAKRRTALRRGSAYGVKGISLVVTIAAGVAVSTGSALNPSGASRTALDTPRTAREATSSAAARGMASGPLVSGPLAKGLAQAPVVADQQEQVRRAVAEQEQAESRARALRVSRDRERARLADLDPRAVARQLAAVRGWGATQFSCLDSLWTKESGWSHTADNPSSSAFGIPQALPGSKMATAGPDWRTNPVTQVRWGLGYIAASYGTPCAAWAHSQSNNWY